MANVDMCEHDWPGSGCKKCFPEPRRPAIFGDITAELVRAEREASGDGLITCRTRLERERVTSAIQGIRQGNHDWRLVADILDWLVSQR